MTTLELSLLERLADCDRTSLLWVAATLRGPLLDRLMLLVTDKWSFALPGAFFAAYLAWRGGRRGREAIVLAVLVALLGDSIGSLLKDLFHRPRPCAVLPDLLPLLDCGPSFSFPSNHAVNSFAVATVIGLFYRRLIPPAVALATVVAYSRVHLGVHYPTDVLAGALVGTALGAALGTAGKRRVERPPPCTSA
jgi:undecaprenyl-diphosphatase